MGAGKCLFQLHNAPADALGSSQLQSHSFTTVTIASLLYGQHSGADFRDRHPRLGPYQRSLNESAVPHVTKEASVALGECTMY